MGTKQLLKRMISTEGRLNASKWHDISNRFATNDYKNVMRAIGEMTTWELEISDKSTLFPKFVREFENKSMRIPNKSSGVHRLPLIDKTSHFPP
ncbi:hypothetical protein CV093_06325 [Oceanobacillus sp. 143]|nr:hypothetical protein CV093_06325 [Oceanobacillus sp. 143]